MLLPEKCRVVAVSSSVVARCFNFCFLLLGSSDGLGIETVGIPSADRLTVCVSSQVGCPMACRFCATGKGGLQRSLAVHEIVDQVLSVREAMGRRPSHVVFMGMGEPLLNIDAVLAAIDCLCRDLGMAQRQMTVSTVGVPRTLPTGAVAFCARSAAVTSLEKSTWPGESIRLTRKSLPSRLPVKRARSDSSIW